MIYAYILSVLHSSDQFFGFLLELFRDFELFFIIDGLKRPVDRCTEMSWGWGGKFSWGDFGNLAGRCMNKTGIFEFDDD
jgi:hypothetical protein